MSQIKNLTRKLSAAYPWTSTPLIVGAPMRIMSGPALAVAVSRAGGLGFIGPSAKTKDTFGDLEEARSRIEADRANARLARHLSESGHLPVGVGFQLWNDDAETAVSAIEEYKPCATWLFAPREEEIEKGQREFDSWTEHIRRVSSQTKIWVQIGTLAEAKALLASRSAPDVVVVQGAEAGGHGRAKDGLGLVSLLPEMADAFHAREDIALVGAGGVADARGAAAVLCLGASGVAMGTRFLAASEARISKGYQDEVVRATDGAANTTRTTLYNQLRGTVGWPDCFSPRTITNRSWSDYLAGVPFAELKKRHDEAAKAGDQGWGPEGRLATYAGASIGLVREVKGADEIVEEVQEGVCQSLDL
ncbi:hypothetical protein ASPZODRAFT_126527 [Penicilliopsis zonata CBS 506.65]|uniref:Uncharacterized protein n=1 Tax=Penicilliopsis zonata CBS 506.65 TaxID=1073090 RepID=A0A1L9STV9_9EURO|nr:hypothetical protein ASPZODRAFT_126527 [Penicilliopsis zonata CBS 506.65]OJJ50629.1 hypothetical protein ASPZODRAFT_126527 [Penicilliopsis zonata CBS 506.65]